MRRAWVILNPSSGRERGTDYVDRLNTTLKGHFDDVGIAVTAGDGDAGRAAAMAVADGCESIFVAGGDGTLNEVMNGLATARALDRVVIGVIPLGTGNDFAAGLGLPPGPEEALDVLLAGRELAVDLGEVNGRIFVNSSGGGFMAEVSVAVTPELKTIAGRLAYLIGGAQTLFEFEPVGATVTMQPGSLTISRSLYTFAVCNSRMVAGGRLIAPDALIDDGLLDVCLMEGMSALEFVALARKVADGAHVQDPRVLYYQVESVRIELERDVHVNTDGEVFQDHRCEYRILPRAARFLAGEAPFSSPA
jgi:diacylglycerol kinase (ATP)